MSPIAIIDSNQKMPGISLEKFWTKVIDDATAIGMKITPGYKQSFVRLCSSLAKKNWRVENWDPYRVCSGCCTYINGWKKHMHGLTYKYHFNIHANLQSNRKFLLCSTVQIHCLYTTWYKYHRLKNQKKTNKDSLILIYLGMRNRWE